MKEIESIRDLTPDPDNPNSGTERGQYMLDLSIESVGAGRSIVADADGVVLAGNKTLQAAADAGIPIKVIQTDGTQLVVVQRTDLNLDGDTAELARKLSYLDNRTAEVGLQWDPKQLLKDIEDGVVLDEMFHADELQELLAGLAEQDVPDDPGPQVDRAVELQEQWGVERGQTWEIPSKSVEGKCHRVMCGDSTSEEDVERLMPNKPKIAIHDPPYGINLDQGWLSRLHEKAGKPRNIAADGSIQGDDGTLDVSCVFGFEQWIVWGFPYLAHEEMTGWLVWDKWPGTDGTGLGNPVEMACSNLWNGFRLIRVMWGGYYRAAGEKREPHPTQKPVGVILPFVEAFAGEGEPVADLFLGSGTLIFACEQVGRIGYGMEIEPKYIAVTLQRLADLGLEPRLAE